MLNVLCRKRGPRIHGNVPRQSLLHGLLGTTVITLSFFAAQASGAEDYAAAALKVFSAHCADCHSNGEKSGGFGSATDLKRLVQERRVVPENPLQSPVYQKMVDGLMPPPEEEPTGKRPTQAELRAVEQWIRSGANEVTVDTDQRIQRDPMSLTATYELMAAHLRKTPRFQRRFIRFFSLRSVYNNLQRTDKELDQYRAAFTFVLNSLSWKREIIVPVCLDKGRVLYAINLNDAGWTDNTWNLLLSQYPYALRHTTLPLNEQLNEAAADVYRECEEDVACLRIDWFVNNATRPPLYDRILGVPSRLAELEKRLGIDSLRNLQNRQVQRAGFVESGISEQHRLIERHSGTFGYYWKSYDFSPDGQRSDLRLFPLGPEWTGHPFPHLAFRHDGGEFIFQLPNGLQGYMLADASGNRLDGPAPTAIVADQAKLSGTVQIFNGISCMACHSQGIIRKQDNIRNDSIAQGSALQLVRDIYPEESVMQQYFSRDTAAFRDAAVRAMTAAGVAADSVVFSDGSILAPVIPVIRFFEKKPIYAEDVAGELGVDVTRLQAAIDIDERMARLGLRSLLRRTGVVQRGTWERRDTVGRSVYQRAANYLRLGEPVLVHVRAPEE